MLKPFAVLFISLFALATISCKNDTKQLKNEVTELAERDSIQKTPVKRASKKELTPKDVAEVQSVMLRIMSEPQLKQYASYIVSAQLADQLSKEEGPFTIFAPSSVSLETMAAEKKKFYSMPENKQKLAEYLKSYIVKGKFDKNSLMQTLANKGKVNLETLSGKSVIATKSGETIVISDSNGKKATVIRGSIAGSNGVVYVIDGLLNAN